jgi:hypothetical protein
MADFDVEIQDIKRLAGLTDLNQGKLQEYTGEGSVKTEASNLTHTAQEKADYQKKHNIEPGTPEWFKLWFSKPYMTGEKPW